MVLGVLVDELLVVGDNALGDCLTDGIDLRSVSSSSHTYADVDVGELLQTNDEQGLIHLEAENLRLHKVQRLSVDLDKTLAGLAVGDRSS